MTKLHVFGAGNNNLLQDCAYCGKREYVFHDNPIGNLVDLAFQTYKYFTKIICIAYIARSFDAQFMFRYLVENKKNTYFEPYFERE